MSKLAFSTLPDVCLLLVFDKIELHDLLGHVNLVNRHWNTISAVACQYRRRLVLSLTSRKHRNTPFGLIIHSVYTDPFDVSKYRNRYYGGEHESLIVPDARKRLNSQSIERLLERLPKISILEVNLDSLPISTNKHLATLINGWREHLVTLKLFTVYSVKREEIYLKVLAKLSNLHATINSLPGLHHLTYQLEFPSFYHVDYFSYDDDDDDDDEITFPISCPSLKELFFTSKYNPEEINDQLIDAFGEYVFENDCDCDYLDCDCDSKFGLKKVAYSVSRLGDFDQILQTSDVLASKTTHINIHFTQTENLLKIFNKFYNLAYITYEINHNFAIDKFSKGFSVLENLTHITFKNDIHGPDRAETQPDSIIPLTLIKSVYLDFENILEHQYLTELLYFDLAFPSVELLTIDNLKYNCIPCGGHFSAASKKTIRKSEWHNCIEQFLAPIAKCDKLKRIEYRDDDGFKFCCSQDKFKLAWADFID